MSTSIAIVSPEIGSPRKESSRPAALSHPGRPAAQASVAPGGRSIKPLFLALPLGLLILAGVITYFVHASRHEETDDAYVTSRIHQISPRVSGTVTEVLVTDFASVEAGQPLLKLDPRDFEVALREAKANLAQAEAGVVQADAALAQSRAQVEQSKANLAQTDAQRKKSQLDFHRAQQLFERPPGGTKVITQADFDTARAALDVATANQAAASSTRDAAEAAVRAAEASLKVARAKQETAAASVANAELQLSYTTVTAPVAGRLGKRGVEIGQRVSPGQALLGLAGGETWILANFKEGQLNKMRAGQPVTVTIDAIKGHEFAGRVESFSAATGATFALLPPDNATGNFTKVVQRVPVKIVLTADSLRGFEDRLRPGLSSVVDVTVK